MSTSKHEIASIPSVALHITDPMLAMIERVCKSPDFDMEKMQKLIDMRNAETTRNGVIAFNESFCKLQGELPSILRSGVVDFKTKNGRTNYTHATLEDIISQIKSHLEKNGFSISHIKTHLGKDITMETTLKHIAGQEIKTVNSAPPDITGNKNIIQAGKSTASYLVRENICCLLNIATKDADDDGRGGGTQSMFITPEQATKINELLEETKADKIKFIDGYMKVKSIPEILAKDYKKATIALQAKSINILKTEIHQANTANKDADESI